jgi:hypothetical protein
LLGVVTFAGMIKVLRERLKSMAWAFRIRHVKKEEPKLWFYANILLNGFFSFNLIFIILKTLYFKQLWKWTSQNWDWYDNETFLCWTELIQRFTI